MKGLNKAGFSDKDYKLADSTPIEKPKSVDPLEQLSLIIPNYETIVDTIDDIDTTRIVLPTETELPSSSVSEIEITALEQNKEFEKKLFPKWKRII